MAALHQNAVGTAFAGDISLYFSRFARWYEFSVIPPSHFPHSCHTETAFTQIVQRLLAMDWWLRVARRKQIAVAGRKVTFVVTSPRSFLHSLIFLLVENEKQYRWGSLELIWKSVRECVIFKKEIYAAVAYLSRRLKVEYSSVRCTCSAYLRYCDCIALTVWRRVRTSTCSPKATPGWRGIYLIFRMYNFNFCYGTKFFRNEEAAESSFFLPLKKNS